MAETTMSERWIDSERGCTCSVMIGYPEPDCEVHGMDACYGRYDSCWWGRIRLPHARKRPFVPAAPSAPSTTGAEAHREAEEAQEGSDG